MLTQERLKEVLDYDADTGVFNWKISIGTRAEGGVAGGVDDGGYIAIRIDKKGYKAHRLAILYTDGYWPENTIDHINRIKTDNRRANLREASMQCQNRNCGMRGDNTSGIKGVYWHKRIGKWQAQIAVDGQDKYLGYFEDILESAYARYAAEQCLGFQDCDIHSSAKKLIQGGGGALKRIING